VCRSSGARAIRGTSSWWSSTSRRCRAGYRIGVPEPGWYRELLNSDAELYGGGNVGNGGGVMADHSLSLDVPPLGFLLLKR
jgi:1,4-alpha-glucan branching enzyme